MTKKDYIKFADMLRRSRATIEEAENQSRRISAEGLERAIERDIADIFVSDNPRFDYARFMDYIGHK